MKTIKLIFISLFLWTSSSLAQLAAGDIAFIGMNTDATEGYSFITLTDIPGSEVIFFSDRGIINSGSYILTVEGTYKFTAPAGGISCGTIVSFNETSPDTYTVSGVAGATMTLESGSANLGSGDQVYAYQTVGDVLSTVPSDATFIAGIHCDYDALCEDVVTKWTQESCVSSTSECIVPPGLTNGTNCVAVTPGGPEMDNMRYTGTLTGTSTFLRGEINDFSNWETNNSPPYDIDPSGYASPSVTCVAPCSNPTIPTVTFTPSVICAGETATLNISGTLNDATAWHIYTGSCGGTELGSTAGTTFDVDPVGAGTEYFIRGEGGCVTPGSCQSITVPITPEDDASFSYDEATYCPNGADPTPSITLAGGTFTSDPAGLVIDGSSGLIDLSESDLETYTITYNTDGDCPSSSEVTLTIEDNDAPVGDLETLPDVTAECEVTSLTNPGVTDNCTADVIITNDADLPITDQGTTTITWTYDDGNGNTSTQTQNIVIDDISGPTPDAGTLADITAECEVTTLTFPTATDNCGGEVTVSNDATLPITEQGTTTITWTYEDENGNSSIQTQDVVINDITAPVPDADPLEDFTAACEITELPTPTATDNCGGEVTVTSDATFPITEATTVTWTYDDGNGNTVVQTQDIVFEPIDVSTSTSDGIAITANNADASSYQWIDCSDLSEISGATDQSYTATENGSYAVIITEGECSDTSECVEISEVSIAENPENQVLIYPNPVTQNFFTIKTNLLIDHILLIDMAGNVIKANYNLNDGQVDVSELPSGSYIATIKTTTGAIVKKEIIILK